MGWDRPDEEDEEAVAREAAAIDSMTPEQVQARATAVMSTIMAPANDMGGASVADAFQAISEAQRRIEKAGLYQAILNQNVFGTGSARQDIIEEVNNDLRGWALERLEVMLGMRQSAQAAATATQFTAEEAAYIRELAHRAMIGSIPVLGPEEVMAFRLLLSKITGKAPTMPNGPTPTLTQVTTPQSTVTQVTAPRTVVTPVSPQAAPVQPAAPPVAQAPMGQPKPPVARRRPTTKGAKPLPMPSLQQEASKIVADSANAGGVVSGSQQNADGSVSASIPMPGSEKLLALAIQTALKGQ